ncbi:hypothetical protein DUU84_05200 [Salmonella enterica subsp. enterica]|nr:hypothetical protein [Salmonella enterica subsp. enterica serovar Okatie]
MLSGADLDGLGDFVIFHAIILLIIGVSLFTGIVKYKSSIGKILILIAIILSIYFLMVFKFNWNTPWNFWDR